MLHKPMKKVSKVYPTVRRRKTKYKMKGSAPTGQHKKKRIIHSHTKKGTDAESFCRRKRSAEGKLRVLSCGKGMFAPEIRFLCINDLVQKFNRTGLQLSQSVLGIRIIDFAFPAGKGFCLVYGGTKAFRKVPCCQQIRQTGITPFRRRQDQEIALEEQGKHRGVKGISDDKSGIGNRIDPVLN